MAPDVVVATTVTVVAFALVAPVTGRVVVAWGVCDIGVAECDPFGVGHLLWGCSGTVLVYSCGYCCSVRCVVFSAVAAPVVGGGAVWGVALGAVVLFLVLVSLGPGPLLTFPLWLGGIFVFDWSSVLGYGVVGAAQTGLMFPCCVIVHIGFLLLLPLFPFPFLPVLGSLGIVIYFLPCPIVVPLFLPVPLDLLVASFPLFPFPPHHRLDLGNDPPPLLSPCCKPRPLLFVSFHLPDPNLGLYAVAGVASSRAEPFLLSVLSFDSWCLVFALPLYF